MKPEFAFILACIGLSLTLTYIWWMRLRVWMFREELFAIRNELWDAMLAKNDLENPAHREFRAGANALIRLAPMLSIFTVLRLVLNEDDTRNLLPRQQAVVIEEIEKSRHKLVLRVVRFILFESLSGLLIVLALAVFGLAFAFKRTLEKRIQALLDSHSFQDLDEHWAVVESRSVTSV